MRERTLVIVAFVSCALSCGGSDGEQSDGFAKEGTGGGVGQGGDVAAVLEAIVEGAGVGFDESVKDRRLARVVFQNIFCLDEWRSVGLTAESPREPRVDVFEYASGNKMTSLGWWFDNAHGGHIGLNISTLDTTLKAYDQAQQEVSIYGQHRLVDDRALGAELDAMLVSLNKKSASATHAGTVRCRIFRGNLYVDILTREHVPIESLGALERLFRVVRARQTIKVHAKADRQRLGVAIDRQADHGSCPALASECPPERSQAAGRCLC